MAGKNDNNDSDNKDSGKESEDKENQDAGAGKENSDQGSGEVKLTKADIQAIITETLAAAIKDQITPEIDRRISGAAKTIYKKAGIKEDSDDSKGNNADVESAAKLKDRLEVAAVYAETTIKEETGKLDEDEQELIDTLIGVEMSRVEYQDGQSVKDIGKTVGTAVLKKYKKLKEKIEGKKIDALKKAGQVIEVTEPGRSENKVNDFDQGKKLAEKRHPQKAAG